MNISVHVHPGGEVMLTSSIRFFVNNSMVNKMKLERIKNEIFIVQLKKLGVST